MVLDWRGSKAKKRTVPRRLNIRHERPASWVLMVGLNMAPPPPGPITWKSPGRAAVAAEARSKQVKSQAGIARIRADYRNTENQGRPGGRSPTMGRPHQDSPGLDQNSTGFCCYWELKHRGFGRLNFAGFCCCY